MRESAENKDSPSNGQESEIVRRAQQGDRAAVKQLFGDHLATVHRFALRMCRDEDRARDVAQESLLTALKSLEGYRGEASFSTWLFTIARSHCGKVRRRDERERVQDDPDTGAERMVSQSPAPDAQAAHGQITDIVESGLDALDSTEREVILLRDVEGLPAADAARVLGITVAALKSRLHRARAALREHVRQAVDRGVEKLNPSCPDILAAFSQRLEGDLTTDHCAALEAHLAECPGCTERCEAMQRLLGACASLRSRPESPEVRRILEETIASFGAARS